MHEVVINKTNDLVEIVRFISFSCEEVTICEVVNNLVLLKMIVIDLVNV